MNTLADIKRKLVKGQKLKVINTKWNKNNIGKVRYVVKSNTQGIYLNEDKNAEKGNYLEFPKASLLEITEKGFKMYCPGKRELTEKEKEIVDNQPSNREENKEIAERDLLTDGSSTFWMDKRYFKENNAEWYWGLSRGLRFDSNDRKMIDDKIKGELSLEYEFVE
jgi:hypothetical protein